MNILFFILFLIFSISISISEEGDRLVFLYTHFRHGARAPMAINEDYKDLMGESWDNPGELTGIGQRMHYLLGLRNRIKYIENEKFVKEKFDPHEILIYSSNLNRTMVSCSSQLQGLYPQKSEKGNTLTPDQERVAFPQVDVNCSEINQEIENLNYSALPYYMTIAPVRMVNDNDKKMNVYDIQECTEERDQVKKKNRETIPYLINFTQNFNDVYGETLNNFFNTPNKTYNLLDIDDFCDAFLSSYTDQRELTEFKKTKLGLEETNDYCYEYFRVTYLYHFHGDNEKILAHVDSSKLMSELLFHMKRRLDADITVEDEDENIKDYSRPKWLMISGHDSTTSADEIFMLNALGLNVSELYIFPKYAAQLALEVRAKNDSKKSSYNDYYVTGFFNDKELFNVTADEFISKIETDIWSQEKIDKFCGFEGNSNGNNTTPEDKKDKAKTAYKVLMSIFICLSAILLATTILLAYKLSKKNSVSPPLDRKFNPNKTDVSMKDLN